MTQQPTFTNPRITMYRKDSILAKASVKVADAIYLTGIRVCQGKNGLFVSMPNRKTLAGDYEDIFFAASKASRDELTRVILAAYHAEVAQ